MKIPGGCYCTAIRYEITLDSPDEARMSICHCPNCKKFTGSENGITAKIPRSSFRLTQATTIPFPFFLFCYSSFSHFSPLSYIFHSIFAHFVALPYLVFFNSLCFIVILDYNFFRAPLKNTKKITEAGHF